MYVARVTAYIAIRGHRVEGRGGCSLCGCARFATMEHDCPKAKVEIQTSDPWPAGFGPAHPKRGPVEARR